MNITYHPIGTIHTPFATPKGMPIQPAGAQGVQGTVEVLPEFAPGLEDLDGFSHVMLLFHFDRSDGFDLHVTPFLDDMPRGLFATRAPKRPNAIGLSVVKLLRIEGTTLHVENVDILDGTPLLDIKPYVSEFDHHPADRFGWLGQVRARAKETKADDRFA